MVLPRIPGTPGGPPKNGQSLIIIVTIPTSLRGGTAVAMVYTLELFGVQAGILRCLDFGISGSVAAWRCGRSRSAFLHVVGGLSIYMYVCTYVYTCANVCACVYVYVCVYVFVYIHIYMYMYIRICTCTCIWISICTRLCLCLCPCVCLCSCVCMYVYLYTYMHMYGNLYMPSLSSQPECM